MSQLIAYAPSIFALALAALFLLYPPLAAYLLAGGLIFFAIAYASMITQFLKLRRNARGGYSQGPNFKQVTIQLFEKGGTWLSQPEDSINR